MIVKGRQLRLMRVARGMTQTDLGDAVGLGMETLCRVEAESQRLGAKSLRRILEVLLEPEEKVK